MLSDHLLPGATTVYALGVDEGSAVGVDASGTGTLFNDRGARGAYLVRASARPSLQAGQSIRYTVDVSHVARNGERFDLLTKTTTEPWYPVTVDGSRTPVYSRSPYRR
jgi:hypothetical protein